MKTWTVEENFSKRLNKIINTTHYLHAGNHLLGTITINAKNDVSCYIYDEVADNYIQVYANTNDLNEMKDCVENVFDNFIDGYQQILLDYNK